MQEPPCLVFGPFRLDPRDERLWWGQARRGTRQIAFITGAAEIGKTALVDAFVAHMSATQTLWVGQGQCIEPYGPGEPYLPVLEAL